jgi:hypothetical protein
MRIAGVFGALTIMAIVLIGAFAVVDKRAAEAFKAESVMIPRDTRGASTANARSMSKPPQQFTYAQGTPAASSARTDTATNGTAAAGSLDVDEPIHRKAHHRRRWHHRR